MPSTLPLILPPHEPDEQPDFWRVSMGPNDRTTFQRARAAVRRQRAVLALSAATTIALLAGRAHGASGTWSGAAADGLWVTPGNWNTVPGASDGTFVSA